MNLIKIAAGALAVVVLACLGGIYFRKPPRTEADRRKVVTRERADTVSVQEMMARLEAERAAAIAAAVEARLKNATDRPPMPAAIARSLEKATKAWQAAHNGANPPPLEASQDALLPYFENAKEAADFAAWLNTGRTSRR
jgi:hypothetical protein